MTVGRTLGYVLLSLVDALLLPVLIVAVGVLTIPAGLVDEAIPYLLLLGAVSFVVALIAAFVSVRRGGTPFPVTRGTKAVATWVLRWAP